MVGAQCTFCGNSCSCVQMFVVACKVFPLQYWTSSGHMVAHVSMKGVHKDSVVPDQILETLFVELIDPPTMITVGDLPEYGAIDEDKCIYLLSITG